VDVYGPLLLDPNKHKRDQMNCGNADLDDWLKRYAGQSRRGNTAATWVITDDQHVVVCYATLSMTSIDRSSAPKALGQGAPSQIPSLLLGRLATDRSVAGLGLGTDMVHHVLKTAVELNLSAGCRAVVVNALDASAYSWWKSLGFDPFDDTDPQNLDLYLLSSDIQATLAN
jgi:hypothetical protein